MIKLSEEDKNGLYILLVVFLKYAFDTLKIILRKLDIITELITKRELFDFQAV